MIKLLFNEVTSSFPVYLVSYSFIHDVYQFYIWVFTPLSSFSSIPILKISVIFKINEPAKVAKQMFFWKLVLPLLRFIHSIKLLSAYPIFKYLGLEQNFYFFGRYIFISLRLISVFIDVAGVLSDFRKSFSITLFFDFTAVVEARKPVINIARS